MKNVLHAVLRRDSPSTWAGSGNPQQPESTAPDTVSIRRIGLTRIVFDLDPRRVLITLLSVIALLTLASTVAASSMYRYRWPEDSVGFDVVKLFWLDSEANLPTLFSSMQLFISAVLLFMVGSRAAQAGNVDAARWKLTGAIFVFLGFDEGARIHETIGAVAGDSFLLGWVVVYTPILCVLAAWMLPFLLRLASRTRWLLIASGLLFVGGALGVETFSQFYAHAHSKTSVIYAGLATLEEILEMAGIAVLIYTLLEYLQQPAANREVAQLVRGIESPASD